MSNAAIFASTAGASAAAAAAAKARKEEEEMTKYNADDLDGWEFKIMRSTWGHFGKREKFQQICEEEAAAGWEMVEKFDNYRVRFKRRIDRRSNDRHLVIDPYRIAPGNSGSGKILMLIIGIIMVLLGGLFVADIVSRGGDMPWMLVTAIGVAIIGLAMAVVLKKR